MAQRRHSERVPGTGRASRARPTGPQGGTWEPSPPPNTTGTRVRCTLTTHSGPAGLRGPPRCQGLLLTRAGGWVVLPLYTHPGIPTRLYPPWYHTPYPPTSMLYRHPVDHPRHRAPGTCTYDRFDHVVGEPRGIEYTPVSGSRAGLVYGYWFTRPFDWFYDCFEPYLPVFTRIYPYFP